MAKGRKEKRKSKPGEIPRFANLPVELVLKSEAVTTLNHAAFRVLTILSGQCWYRRLGENEGNNGTAALTEMHAKQYGFKGRDTLYGSLRELTERGLIVVTREGLRLKSVFTLYAVGWLPVTHVNAQQVSPHIAATAIPIIPNCLSHLGYIPDFREWKSSKEQSRKSVPEAGIRTDGRECTVPISGSDESKYVPTVGNRATKYVPTIGNTLRSTGRAGLRMTSVSAQASAQPVSPTPTPSEPT
jgi:hypothetical protein